jgi:hypothetical protein
MVKIQENSGNSWEFICKQCDFLYPEEGYQKAMVKVGLYGYTPNEIKVKAGIPVKQEEEALNYMRPGDTLVVWKLDHLGRSLKHQIEVVNDLHEKGVGFRSLQENMDSTSRGGKLIFHVSGALAEFEREIIRERPQAVLAATRARGRLGESRG